MSLFIKQDESRTRMQQQIAAELQAKAKEKAKQADLPDGVADSNYIKGTKQTGKFGGVWLIVIVIIVVIALVLTFTGGPR
jgi:hypothetical protein